MQKLNFFLTPTPHIIIDEFLSPRAARLCLEEAIKLKSHYKQAQITDDNDLLKDDDCEDCKMKRKINRNVVRDNKVIYLDLFYKESKKSVIINCLIQSINFPEFKQYLCSLPGLFPIITSLNSTESILSSYGKCDFYGWHTDPLPNRENERILTLVYYFNKEPVKFKGGDLIITGNTVHDQKHIIPKHNRAVIFLSDKCVHAVDNVIFDGDFEYSRFSVNFWLGIGGPYKFK